MASSTFERDFWKLFILSFPDGESNCTLKEALRRWPDLKLYDTDEHRDMNHEYKKSAFVRKKLHNKYVIGLTN